MGLWNRKSLGASDADKVQTIRDNTRQVLGNDLDLSYIDEDYVAAAYDVEYASDLGWLAQGDDAEVRVSTYGGDPAESHGVLLAHSVAEFPVGWRVQRADYVDGEWVAVSTPLARISPSATPRVVGRCRGGQVLVEMRI
jgi:hypothetical protein